MYCGDSVPSIIGEVGSRWAKFGFSGDDKPSVVSRSVRVPSVLRPLPGVAPFGVGSPQLLRMSACVSVCVCVCVQEVFVPQAIGGGSGTASAAAGHAPSVPRRGPVTASVAKGCLSTQVCGVCVCVCVAHVCVGVLLPRCMCAD